MTVLKQRINYRDWFPWEDRLMMVLGSNQSPQDPMSRNYHRS